MEMVQNSAYSDNTARPSSALSETSDGYIPMGDGYEDVSGYEPPTLMTVDNQAYSGQPHQVTVVDNQAYNGHDQVAVADDHGEPHIYESIYPNSSQLYEQIPERVEPKPSTAVCKRVSMRKALCSFKQGKAEIGIRISILLLGALLVPLHLSTVGLIFAGTAFTLYILLNLCFGTIWPGLIIVIGSVELGIYCCRTNKKKASRGFATWDIMHSNLIGIFYFLCGVSALGFAVLFFLGSQVGSLLGGIVYIIISILCFVQMILYTVKANLMAEFFERGWDQKVEEYMAAHSTNV